MIGYIPEKNEAIQIYSKRLQKMVALGRVVKNESFGDGWRLTVTVWPTNEKKEYTTSSYTFQVVEQR